MMNTMCEHWGMDGLDKAIRWAGSQAELCRRLGVKPQVMSNWRRRGVPLERCVDIEAATRGEVMRWELRSDWRRIWPDLARRKAAPKTDAMAFSQGQP